MKRRIKLRLGYIQRVSGGWEAFSATWWLQKPWIFSDLGSALKWLGYSPIEVPPRGRMVGGVVRCRLDIS